MQAQKQKTPRNAAPERTAEKAPNIAHFGNIVQDILVVINNEGRILWANDAFFEMTGYGDQDLSSLHFMDLFVADDKPDIRDIIGTFKIKGPDETQPTLDFEARLLTKDGIQNQTRWRQKLCNGLLYCAGHDITPLKEQEEALRRREKQLSEAESIGRMGHWNWSIGQNKMAWSDEIFSIFGVDKNSFIPTFDAMTAMVDRTDIARVNQALQRALIEENDYDMEFRITTPGGSARYIRCEGRCGRDKQGEVVSLYGIMQDMTERVLYECELKAAKDNAERAYAAKTQFLANMSHELRTPLNAIIGFSEMIERQILGPVGTEKYLEYIAGIRESGTHLLDLISDILDMSKIEAGKYELDLEEISLAKTLQLALHMMEGRAHESGVKISLDVPPDETLKITADRRAVLQILLNILSNGVKFTPEGGTVRLECMDRKDYVLLKIADNGIGIPASKLSGIARPFEQVSSSYARNHEGSGLGLAITKELVDMHGGIMSIDSTLDVGTTVTIRLPKKAKKT